jgi:hypothetical protein
MGVALLIGLRPDIFMVKASPSLSHLHPTFFIGRGLPDLEMKRAGLFPLQPSISR